MLTESGRRRVSRSSGKSFNSSMTMWLAPFAYLPCLSNVSRHAAIIFAAMLGALSSRGADKTAASGDLAMMLKQKVVTEAVGSLLNNQLPLKLDASDTFPTVSSLPGEAFHPQRLPINATSVNEPLPPGDYSLRAIAFCSEYSIHRAGAGVAYQVGPIQGRAADAIAALYWRGTLEKHQRPRSLLSVGWAIQGGVTYAKMTKSYQALVDEIIPEFKNQLGSDFVQNLEDLYAARAKGAGLPPLNTLLTQLGKPGELVLSANRQRQALLRRNTNDQIKDQVLFAGQEQKMAAVKPEEGPWSERIPGVAYVRYRVVGGNVRANNEIQIRILPPPAVRTADTAEQKVVLASYSRGSAPLTAAAKPKANAAGPSVRDLTGDGIGYSTSRAAQVLYFVPAPDAEPKDGDSVGKADALQGAATLTRNGETHPLKKGDEIKMGDQLTTSDGGKMSVTLADGTQLSLGPNASVKIDTYVYNPTNPEDNRAVYRWLSGPFRYVSGLIAKKPNPDINIDTPYGCLGIRGTELIGQPDPSGTSAKIKLISGTVEFSPLQISTSTVVTGPMTIEFSSAEVKTSPLTLPDYNAIKPTILIR